MLDCPAGKENRSLNTFISASAHPGITESAATEEKAEGRHPTEWGGFEAVHMRDVWHDESGRLTKRGHTQ